MEKNKGVAGSSLQAKMIKGRLLLPMNICCNTCRNYVYKNTILNSRVECVDRKYLGGKIVRCYINCTKCSAEIIIKAESNDNDYVVESGAARIVEPVDEVVAEEQRRRDTRKASEEITVDNMDEINSIKSRQPTACIHEMLQALQRSARFQSRQAVEAMLEALRQSPPVQSRQLIARIDAMQRSTLVQAGDTMKSLENRTLDSKREMDIHSALDGKLRQAAISVDAVLEALQRSAAVQKRKISHVVSDSPTEYLMETKRIKREREAPTPHAKNTSK